jgi:hypothetical protein
MIRDGMLAVAVTGDGRDKNLRTHFTTRGPVRESLAPYRRGRPQDTARREGRKLIVAQRDAFM